MLSGINLDSKSATVEWFENGETKGKEVGSGKHSCRYCHTAGASSTTQVKTQKL
jgi:hypothetical protein